MIPGNHDNRAAMLETFHECCQADRWPIGPGAAVIDEPAVSFSASVPAADGREWRLLGLDSGGVGGAPALAPSQLRRENMPHTITTTT